MKKIVFTFLTLTLCLICVISQARCRQCKETKIIAHRGFWQLEGSAQNSLKALEGAAEQQIYAVELDVHLTADKQLIVFHDNIINGKLIGDMPSSEVLKVKLANGETIPTLDQYLSLAQKFPDLVLFLEIKGYPKAAHNKEAAAKIVEAIDKYDLAKRTQYISFDMDAAQEVIKLRPRVEVAYLGGDRSPADLKKLGFAGIDYHFSVMRNNPKWFNEARELGMSVNVWTIDDPQIMAEMIGNGVDYITTDFPLIARKVARNSCK